MSSRPLIIASLLGASIGVPYISSRLPSAESGTDGPAAAQEPGTTPLAPRPRFPLDASPVSNEHRRIHAIEQVLRFDLTRQWVSQNWDRQSTGPTDVGLFGVRVPLVTGTQPGALAGSLTYYFNSHGQIEHISFRGRTGDPAALTNFLARTYEFQPVAAPVGERVYQVTRRGRPQSELRIRPESVIRTSSPQRNYAVELELARPGTRRYLPPRGPQLEMPQVASPAVTPSESAAGGGSNSLLDNVRYATPQEKGQVRSQRWPN